MRNDFFGEMAETGGVPLNASPVRRWAGVFGHRPFAFSISMGVKTSDGMNWNLQDLVYEALSEEWRKRDGEISDPWANDEADGYQPPSYEPVNPWSAEPPDRSRGITENPTPHLLGSAEQAGQMAGNAPRKSRLRPLEACCGTVVPDV